MHRNLLRAFVKLARHATTLVLLGLVAVGAGVAAESVGLTLVGLAVLAFGRLAQKVQTGRYERKRHEAEVRNKYKTLVAEHWKLTPPPTPVATRLGAMPVRPMVAVSRSVRPNHSVNRTRYGSRRKPGVRRLRHLRTPDLRRPPPRAGYLER